MDNSTDQRFWAGVCYFGAIINLLIVPLILWRGLDEHIIFVFFLTSLALFGIYVYYSLPYERRKRE